MVAAVLAGLVGAPAGQAALVSQGGVRMGADALWSHGILGRDQAVAILDQGFAEIDRSIALGELPPREAMTIRTFDPGAGLDGRTEFGQPTQHGVRMAEIVHDIAPDARLALVSYTTPEQFAQAAAWIAAQGIPVVSHSNSFLSPPFDGTSPAAQAVDAAAAAGVLWVNSAGNYAARHWRGAAPASGAAIPIAPPAGLPMLFSLAWSGGSVAASVALERADGGGGWTEVRRSVPAGPGNAVIPPVTAEAAGYRLVVRQEAGPPAALDLFSETVGFGAAAVAEGSIPTPGDAAGALTVGAVKWTGIALEPYSSQGVGGAAKPDLVGPTYVTSNPEWPGTAGTSAATAHVAGAALLLRQARRAAGLPAAAADLRAALVAAALDLGVPGRDPLFGAGMARLDAGAPRLSLRIGRGAHRLVRVRAEDEGTIRDVRISMNGRLLRVVRRPVAAVRLPALPGGTSTVTVRAEDMAGNVSTRTRTLRAGR
jgi:uncharacterized protein YndB with AHSA1/START domain